MNEQEHKLAATPIHKLLIQYSLPAIVGTMVLSIYNVVDRIFIGQVLGPDAISGLALTFPILTLSGAIGMLVGVGASARISIVLGMKDKNWAERILGNSLILSLGFSLLYVLCFALFMQYILRGFGGSAVTIPYAQEYLLYMLPGFVINNLCFSFNSMMRASGYPLKAMLTMMIGAFLNVILDYLFIVQWGLGIKGASLATVISMGISTLWVMSHFFSDKSVIRFRRHSFVIERRIIINVLSIGLAPFLINVTSSVVNAIINTSLQSYGGDIAVGAFGIVNSVAMLLVMLILGLCQGMQPIVGYNFGADQSLRVRNAYFSTVGVATFICLLGFFASQVIPQTLARLFTSDELMIQSASHGLRCVLLAFPIVGFQIVTTNLFQSLGMARKAIFLSITRQVIFLIPALFVLPRFMGLEGVWYASPVADTIASLVTLWLLYQQRRLFISPKKL